MYTTHKPYKLLSTSAAGYALELDSPCEAAKQFYNSAKIEKERFDACEQENNEFWRRIRNLEKTYTKSKLNVDNDKTQNSLWSEKCVSNPELYEHDIDHNYCKNCCGVPTITRRGKRGYRKMRQDEEDN
ncbi:hypothetical protein BH18THE2_BH18THE2_09120 [soil metagenome]